MAKADLIAEAQSLGVTLTGEETVAKLQELLAAAKPAEKQEQTEFVVINSDGGEVRTFTLEIHGERAGELAQEFAATNGYTVQS